MSTVSTRGKVGQRPSAGLYAANFRNKFALKCGAFFDGGNRPQFDDDFFSANFGQLLFTQPIASAGIQRVGAMAGSCKTNIERSSVSGLPDVDIHGVFLVNCHLESVA